MVFNTILLASHLKSKIAHHSANKQIVLELPLFLELLGTDDQDLIAGDFLSFLIHSNQPVTVTVKSESNICFRLDHPFLKILSMLRSTMVIDIETVGGIVDDLYVGTQLKECVRSNLVGGPICRIEDNLDPLHC